MQYINAVIAIAKQDFPALDVNRIKVHLINKNEGHQMAQGRFDKKLLIEFQLPAGTPIPAHYEDWSQWGLPLIYG